MSATEGNSVLKGAFFAVFGRWAGRLIGMASTVVLARLLMPEDFGVVAMAFMVLGLAATLLDIGVNVALVRNRNATEEHFHSAWTLRLLQTVIVAATLIAVAPLAGVYFKDARVSQVIMLLAANVAIGGLENIGIVKLQKEQQFDIEFRFLIVNRLFAFLCTIGLALWLRNYWALVIAGTASTLFKVAYSYRLHPMRPRFSFARVREILSVSQWMLVQNVGLFLDSTLHKVFVGRREGPTTMGAYALAAEIASLPSTELLQPLNRVLFPFFVAAKDDLTQLRKAFLLAQSVQVMVALPAAVFVALLAPVLIPVLLGEKWMHAVPFLQVLAIGAALGAIQASAWYVSITLGRERESAYLTWGQIGLVVFLLLVIFPDGSAQRIAEVRAVVPLLGLLLQLYIVSRAIGGLRGLEVLSGLWRTALSVALVGTVVAAMPSFGSPVLDLLARSLVCAGLYPLTLLAAWKFCGAPQGAERYLLQRLAPLLESILRRRKRAGKPPV